MGWHERDMTPEIHADYYRVSKASQQFIYYSAHRLLLVDLRFLYGISMQSFRVQAEYSPALSSSIQCK